MNGNQDTTRPPEGYAGHEPLPTVQGSKPFIDCSEHVEVVYSHVYRCQHCGYVPPEFGCNPKMREHLKEAHGIEEPLDAWWWMSGYHDNRLKRELTELAALRARLAELEAKPEPPTDYAMALDSLRDALARIAALERERDNFKSRTEAACAVARAQGKTLDALRAENERLRTELTRIATEDCTYGAGIDCAEKALAACVRVAKAALANPQEARE